MTENWYIVLGLEFYPNPVSDETVIANKIEEKRKFWTRNEGDINCGADYRKYGQMLESIKRDMIGEANIRTELIKHAYEKVCALIDPKLKMIRKTEISEDTIAKIAAKVEKEAKFEVNTEIVRSRVLALGIKIGASGGGDYRAVYEKYYRTKPLNADKFNGMNSMLKSFNVNNLYEFLYIGMAIKNPQNLPCDKLRLRAKEKKSLEFYKHDSISGSGSKLCGLCEECFKDDASKQIYDKYLEYNKRKDILDNVKSSYEIADELTREAYFEFVGKLTELSKNRQDAEYLLSSFCKVEKIPLAPFSSLTEAGASTIKVCRCGCMNDVSDGRKLCRACGLELQLLCPMCGKRNDANIRVCKCGFKFENIDKALSLCELSEDALCTMDFTVAEILIRDAEKYWPGSPKTGELRLRMRELKARVGNAAYDLKKACLEKEYYEASKLLERVKSFAPGYSRPEIEEEISSGIAEAEKYKRIAQTSRKEEDIVEACIRAHEFCKDLPGIKEIMAKYPPAPPTHLVISADSHARVNALSWDKSRTQGLLYYYVVRKEGAIPINSQDGTLVGRVSTCSMDDRDVSPGARYFYSVFAERAGIYSEALNSEHAVCNLFEISNLRISAGDALLRLEWGEVSDHAVIEIERTDAFGRRTKLMCNSRNSYVDRGLDNEREYKYRVFLTYLLGTQKISTQGLVISGTPVRLPFPIKKLIVKSGQNNDFLLEWDQPEEGDVQFFYAKEKPDFLTGDLVPVSELESGMNSLVVSKTGENQAVFQFEGEEPIYILAVSAKSGTAVIGACARAIKGGAVNIKHVSLVNGDIFIAIEPPKDATGFVVLYRNDEYPADISDADSTRLYIPIKQYDHDGGLLIDSAQPFNYYFFIFAEFGADGESDCSSGSRYLFRNVPKQEISYSIKVNKKLFGGAAVDIVFEGGDGVFVLPDIDIFSAQDRVPMFKKTGKLFYQIPAREASGSVEIRIPLEKGLPRETYIKPFLRNEELSGRYVFKMKPGSENKIT